MVYEGDPACPAAGGTLVRPTARGIVRPERVAREVAGILDDVTTAVDRVVAAPHPSAESLHRLHRQMRRLRTGLALWETLLPSAERALLRPLDVRIKRLSRLVGRIRDRDIALSLLERFAGTGSGPRDLARVARYRLRVHDDARTGRELLKAFLRSERQAHLLDAVNERLRRRPRSGSFRDPHRAVAVAHARAHAMLRRAHRKARRRPTMERLHQLRIEIRRARQFSDLAARLDPRHERRLPASLTRLQQELGDLHDLDLVLAGLDDEVRRTAWAEALRHERRRHRKSVLRTIESPGLLPVEDQTPRAKAS